MIVSKFLIINFIINSLLAILGASFCVYNISRSHFNIVILIDKVLEFLSLILFILLIIIDNFLVFVKIPAFILIIILTVILDILFIEFLIVTYLTKKYPKIFEVMKGVK